MEARRSSAPPSLFHRGGIPMSEVRPRRKAAFPSYVIDDTIYVQGCGELIEIEDPTGGVRRLLDLLDGTRTVDGVADELASGGNGLSRGDVFEAIPPLDPPRPPPDAARDRPPARQPAR